MFKDIPVVIVAGMGKESKAIGKENGLLWHVPEDMKRFKELTLGKPVIMGRKTFESIVGILGKPLPERTNIVVTRNTEYVYEGAIVVASFEEALEQAASENPPEIHIGGGEEIYRQALPYVDQLHVTFFYDDKQGDAHFPDFSNEFSVAQEHEEKEHEETKFQWVDFTRDK